MEKMKTPKAFIGYVIISLIILISAVFLYFGDRFEFLGFDQKNQNDAIYTSSSNSNQNPGANDMNGSGQNEPTKPVEFTGYQSPIILPLYQAHIVGGEKISEKVNIEVWSVQEDSRCPKEVQCIQAGRVRIGVRFKNPETKNLLIESQVMEVGQTIQANDLEFTLLEVKPFTQAGIKIKDQEYKFIFGIAKLNK